MEHKNRAQEDIVPSTFIFKRIQQLPHLQWCVDEVVIILHCIHNKVDILVNNRLNCDKPVRFF